MKKDTPYDPWEQLDVINLASEYYHPSTMTWWTTLDALKENGCIFTVDEAGKSLKYINNPMTHDSQMKYCRLYGSDFKLLKDSCYHCVDAREYVIGFRKQYDIIWIHQWEVQIQKTFNRLLICEN